MLQLVATWRSFELPCQTASAFGFRRAALPRGLRDHAAEAGVLTLTWQKRGVKARFPGCLFFGVGTSLFVWFCFFLKCVWFLLFFFFFFFFGGGVEGKPK